MSKLSYNSYSFLLEKALKSMKKSAQKILKDLDCGITLEQWRVLKMIYEQEGLSQYEIADATLKDAPTATRIIDLLCKKSLVERRMDRKDRRRFNLFLTKAGSKKVKDLMPFILEQRKKGWKSLTDKDLNDLERILTVIHNNLKNA
ncbi:MAG: MarR family winged helix-turn-helix transcriptional regulator [Cytophagaceae bacterium]